MPRFRRHRSRGCRRRRPRRVRVLRRLRTGAGRSSSDSANGPGAPGGGGGSSDLSAVSNATTSMSVGVSKGHHHDRAASLGDTSDLAQRRNRVPGVLQRIEAGHHIEGLVGERQFLQIALAEVARRHTRSRDRQHRLRRVHAGHLGPTRSRHLRRHARAAAGIEIPGSRPNARALEHGLEDRANRPFLKVGPVPRARTPEATVCFRSPRLQLAAHCDSHRLGSGQVIPSTVLGRWET